MCHDLESFSGYYSLWKVSSSNLHLNPPATLNVPTRCSTASAISPAGRIFKNKGQTDEQRGRIGDSPEWGSALILVPWQQYAYAGNLNLFRLHYDAMTNYLAYFGSRATNYIVNYGLGDWYDLGPKKPGVSQLTPIALTATAFYFS